jgi:hypothetical protein
VTDVDVTQELAAQQEDVDDNYIVVLVAKGGARLKPDEGIKITGFNTDAGPATVGLATRFQEIGLANRLPQDLIFEVRCPGTNLDDAVARGSTLATSLAPLISFAINAFVDVPQAHIACEASPERKQPPLLADRRAAGHPHSHSQSGRTFRTADSLPASDLHER